MTEKSQRITNIDVYGIYKISNTIEKIEAEGLIQKFRGLKKNEVQMVTGEINVLVGFNYASLHPVREQSIGNLMLMKNKFGKCLAGSHISLKNNSSLIVHSAIVYHAIIEEDGFLSIESMGVRCNLNPNCGGCKCGKCALGGKNYTIKEEREQKLIEEGLTFKNGYWLAAYPWIRNPRELPNNRLAALRMLESTERRLIKTMNHANTYTQQIQI